MNNRTSMLVVCLCLLSCLVSQAQNNFDIKCEEHIFKANPNPTNPIGGCESSIELKALASLGSNCTSSKKISWIVLVDLYDDGLDDYEFSSFLPSSDNQNLLSDTNNNGIPDRFVASTLDSQMISLPSFITNILDESHSVKWEARDECGNTTFCNSKFKASDKKAPTPYCVSLAYADMENGIAKVFAKNYNKGSFDNCTAQSELLYTFDSAKPVSNKINKEHYFKQNGEEATYQEYEDGLAQKWLPKFKSSLKKIKVNGVLDVNMSVIDNNYNSDYCKVTSSGTYELGLGIWGTIKTKDGKVIKNVTVKIDAPLAEFPKFIKSDSLFATNLSLHYEYILSAYKNDDYRNGVTTSDMLAIYKHVLGTKLLESPEQLLAADVNRDGKITLADVTLVRKLINGVIDKFPNVDSWIFIPRSHVFTDPKNPFDVDLFIDVITNLDKVSHDFIGIKMGDVNCSADPKSK